MRVPPPPALPRPRGALAVVAACLLLAAPAAAQDLAGLWKVEGTLPGGEPFRGLAAIAPGDQAGEYRVAARARSASGRWIDWRADATSRDSRVETRRHGASQGLVGAILGADAPPAVVGRYALAADQASFAGGYGPDGADPTGQARFVRQADPRVTFEPATVSLRAGEDRVVTVSIQPRGAAGLIRFDGQAVSRVFWQGGARKLTLEPDQPGAALVTARLGPLGGRVLAELPLDVRPRILDEVVERVAAAAAAGERPIVIFDLDDTLFDTRYRVRAILRDYGAEHQEPRLTQLSVRHVRYAMEETLRAAGFSEEEATGPLGREIRRYWSRRFFRGESYALDRPLRGAVRYVARLVAAGARIVYVTGRRDSTRDASLAVLADAGFPIDAIYLKPSTAPGEPKLATDAFKERTAREEIAPQGRVVAAFDNEPKNANAFQRALPGAVVVWVDSIYEPEAPPVAAGIHTVEDLR